MGGRWRPAQKLPCFPHNWGGGRYVWFRGDTKGDFLWGWVGVKVCSTTIASKSWFCSVNMSKCTFSGPN